MNPCLIKNLHVPCIEPTILSPIVACVYNVLENNHLANCISHSTNFDSHWQKID